MTSELFYSNCVLHYEDENSLGTFRAPKKKSCGTGAFGCGKKVHGRGEKMSFQIFSPFAQYLTDRSVGIKEQNTGLCGLQLLFILLYK